ncbi:hypothetical protein NESM_000617200 [Novymonas esmeraldas]|uniref:Uncharacterized protein n=1 Tax=Novymonas esmeraldas TaxID=1808958 RepID=A0AAW0ERI5_9TRYP
MRGDEPLQLPKGAAAQLKTWYAQATKNAPRRIEPLPANSHRFDLFTDATLEGWGAVCIDHETKRCLIAGSRWGVQAHNINGAETRAISCAFSAFRGFLRPGARIDLHIDNTSAPSAVRKGFARSHAINAELRHFLVGLPFHVSATSIRSADNPADLPSRHPLYQTKMSNMRHGNWDSMKG